MTKALLMNSVAGIPAPTFDFIFDFTFDFIFDESDGTPYILWRSKMELGVHLGRLIGAGTTGARSTDGAGDIRIRCKVCRCA